MTDTGGAAAASWQHWTAEQARLQPSTSPAPQPISPVSHATRPASARQLRQLPHSSKAQQRPASAAAYLRLTAKMPFSAHKQALARAEGRNSPEAAHADALGSMLASIAESAAVLDSHAHELDSSVISRPNDTVEASANLIIPSAHQDAALQLFTSAEASVTPAGAQSEAMQMTAAGDAAAAALVRPASAQPQTQFSGRTFPRHAKPEVQSPGSFLKHARPQSAAAANIASHGRLGSFWKGPQRHGSRPASALPAGAAHTHKPDKNVRLHLCLLQ